MDLVYQSSVRVVKGGHQKDHNCGQINEGSINLTLTENRCFMKKGEAEMLQGSNTWSVNDIQLFRQ